MVFSFTGRTSIKLITSSNFLVTGLTRIISMEFANNFISIVDCKFLFCGFLVKSVFEDIFEEPDWCLDPCYKLGSLELNVLGGYMGVDSDTAKNKIKLSIMEIKEISRVHQEILVVKRHSGVCASDSNMVDDKRRAVRSLLSKIKYSWVSNFEIEST